MTHSGYRWFTTNIEKVKAVKRIMPILSNDFRRTATNYAVRLEFKLIIFRRGNEKRTAVLCNTVLNNT